ncbi:bifunctional riboflavin kinase/FAD synthetase [Paenibacillus sp. y28]|uniref:bifunctional riboflavin kinase/FAD synthetase n=1 Tax=Paenibacillus sp. y28 TaxID=3129110 RepID=UPI003018D115
MQVHQLHFPAPLEQLSSLSSPQVLAIGDFDGVHLGHQHVLQRAVTEARQLGLTASVMTFHPHPREVLGQTGYTQYLTPLDEKLVLFEQLGIDCTYVVRFDEMFSHVSPDCFVKEMLSSLKLNTVIVGFDFRFGYLGSGNPDTLCELAHGLFAVEIVRPYVQNGEKVSSTLIRQSLQAGDVPLATSLLGRPYAVSGIVTHGDGRGRTIGFPTANVEPSGSFVVPAGGVYAVRVKLEGETFDGVMNIGTKPTFTGAGIRTLEAHLFDFSDDIYEKALTIHFIAYLRPEQKFASVDELIRQIHADADRAKQILSAS